MATVMKSYDVHNPTKAPRAFHDGREIPKGGQANYIHVPAGETKKGVEVSESVVDEMKSRHRKDNDELTFTEVRPAHASQKKVEA